MEHFDQIVTVAQKNFIVLGKLIYFSTPFPLIRRIYYDAFCRFVRGRYVTVLRDDLRFRLDLSELIDVGIYLGTYEPDVASACARHCKRGSVVLDIGANIGAHALRLAKLVGPTGRVYAFEPTDFAFCKLKQNVALNSLTNITNLKLALSDKQIREQKVDLRASWRTDGTRSDGVSVVSFDRLDHWCDANAVRHVDLIKLDTDGHEFSVLSGGRALIERCRPTFVMEAVGPHFEDDSTNPFAMLQKINYQFFDAATNQEYCSTDAMKIRLPRHDWGMTTSFNVVAIAANARAIDEGG